MHVLAIRFVPHRNHIGAAFGRQDACSQLGLRLVGETVANSEGKLLDGQHGRNLDYRPSHPRASTASASVGLDTAGYPVEAIHFFHHGRPTQRNTPPRLCGSHRSRKCCRYGGIVRGSRHGRRRNECRDQDSRRDLRRRVHPPENRFPSRRAALARRIRAASGDARYRRSALPPKGIPVLVPNPFYRVAKAPFSDASHFSFQDPADMAKLRPLMGIGERSGQSGEGCGRLRRLPGRAKRGEQSEEDRNSGLLHGRTAGGEDRRGTARPHRRGASFHGGGLVTDKPESPHLLAPKIKGRMYFGIASNDDSGSRTRRTS